MYSLYSCYISLEISSLKFLQPALYDSFLHESPRKQRTPGRIWLADSKERAIHKPAQLEKRNNNTSPKSWMATAKGNGKVTYASDRKCFCRYISRHVSNAHSVTYVCLYIIHIYIYIMYIYIYHVYIYISCIYIYIYNIE